MAPDMNLLVEALVAHGTLEARTLSAVELYVIAQSRGCVIGLEACLAVECPSCNIRTVQYGHFIVKELLV